MLGGRYRVVRALGRGGMGAVFEAHQEGLGRRVALKVLHPHLAQDAQLVLRFRREAESAAGLGHPNIVQVTDFGREEDGTVFLVMELLDGVPLAAVIERDGMLSVERVAKIAWQVLSALDVAHRAGIVHRDLKPDNIFVTHVSGVGDVVKLLDFGIAKLAESEGSGLTATGTVMGTPAYMAPEQARGAPVDARVDLYAVGVVMYEALAGRLPYNGNNYNALIAAILTEQPPRLRELRPDLPAEIAAVVERAMSRDPAGRFANAAAMRDALSPWLDASAPGSLASIPVTAAADMGSAETIASTPGVAHRAVDPAAASAGSVPASGFVPGATPVSAHAPTPAPVATPGARTGPWVLLSVILAAIAGGAVVFALTRGGGGAAEPAGQAPIAIAAADSDDEAPASSLDEAVEPVTTHRQDAAAAAGTGVERDTALDERPARAKRPLRALAKRALERAEADRRKRRMRIYASSMQSNNLYPLSEMRATVNRQLGPVEQCYRGREIANGTWALAVDESGRVTRAHQPGYALDDPAIIACVAQALSTIVFDGPPAGGPGEVRIGFEYRPRE